MIHFIITLFLTTLFVQSQNLYHRKKLLMGVDFEFTVVAQNKIEADKYLDKAIEETIRIENLISSWKDNSQTTKINKNAGLKPVKVNRELVQLIKRSKRISELTNGLFDISYASLDRIWYFDKVMPSIPDSMTIKESVSKINYKNIIINESKSTIFLSKRKMKIGFGSIGKGYTAERVKYILKKMGVKAGLINAAGDITTWGINPISKKWVINIANPDEIQNKIGKFNLLDNSVVTSGNYAKYIEFNNKRYSHIINPKTGWPVSGLKSVTIFCKNAELADAIATAVFVMGKELGLSMINKLKGIDCLLITNDGKIHSSNNLKLNYN